MSLKRGDLVAEDGCIRGAVVVDCVVIDADGEIGEEVGEKYGGEDGEAFERGVARGEEFQWQKCGGGSESGDEEALKGGRF